MKVTMVSVVYLDGTVSVVSNDLLDVLIATGRILKFKRVDGWVDVRGSKATLRDYKSGKGYTGTERRAPWSGGRRDLD